MSIFDQTDISIVGSRDKIREQLISYCKKYLDLQDVDLTKTSFLSYVVNILSILSSNQLFYSSTVYNESFLTEARLLESVQNLSKWIGYKQPKAIASTVNVVISIPLGFKDTSVTITIPSTFKVYAGDIPFTIDTKYDIDTVSDKNVQLQDKITQMGLENITVDILNNELVIVRDVYGTSYSVRLTTFDDSDSVASFPLKFTQKIETLYNFQIPTNLNSLQFFNRKIENLNGQVNNIRLYVMDLEDDTFPVSYNNGKSIINNVSEIDTIEKFEIVFPSETVRTEGLWEESETGIFTLGGEDKKYIANIGDQNIDILFGNNIIGKQPNAGQWVFAFISTTNGEVGNVIRSSIITGDPLLFSDTQTVNGESVTRLQRLKYTVTNPFPATGGTDLLTITEIKNNAIVNLRTKNRLVSTSDYNDLNTLFTDLPLDNSIPILKRSDLKINEITLFTTLTYSNPDETIGEEIVPTRNIVFPFDSTSYIVNSDSTAEDYIYIPRGSYYPQDSTTYQTLFDMYINLDTMSADYEYLLKSIDTPVSLLETDSTNNRISYFNIQTANIETEIQDNNLDDIDLIITCPVNNIIPSDSTSLVEAYQIKIKIDDVHDDYIDSESITLKDDGVSVDEVVFRLTDIKDYQTGQLNFKILVLIKLIGVAYQELSTFQFNTIVREDLSDYMYSSISDSTSDSYLIHDVPVVLTEFLTQDEFDVNDFEDKTLQTLIGNIDINSKRMLTDFINIKFCDTYGQLTNMKYNDYSLIILSRTLVSVPVSPTVLDTYIVNGTEGLDTNNINWGLHRNKLAKWSGVQWNFTTAKMNDTVLINDEFSGDQKLTLIFNGTEWIEPIFDIPLKINLKVIKDPTIAITSSAIIANIKQTLLETFLDKFGLDVEIDRSEILAACRNVTGVRFAILQEPSIDIRFKYKLKDLTLDQLVDYTPQLVAFTEDSITISVVIE